MNNENIKNAKILISSLPYIQKYRGKTVVIKYGGSAMINNEMKQSVMNDVVLLHTVGINVVLVHGGGPEITGLLEKVGKETKFVDGLRVTDRETVGYVQMVLAGKVNKTLVNIIQTIGGKAIGLCGIDGNMITAKPKDKRLGFVGEITCIDPTVILDAVDKGYIPVISTVGCDKDGETYNINADTAAAGIASALGAQCMISMTDTPGLLRDIGNPGSLISELSVKEIDGMIESGVISGGMIPKIKCCADCISAGVENVFIIDGRVPHSIIIELLTDEGLGTMITR
ncbi:MAG: acetylglutamate kinase [Clostridia bacterium]|nr:acetylglutamate kinase [Clostridia bacterium]